MYSRIKKRSGQIVSFNEKKISIAIAKAGKATGEFDAKEANKLTDKVLIRVKMFIKDAIPQVEQIQDAVEDILLRSQYKKAAKAFIIYRDQHAKMRELASAANVDMVDSYLEKLDWQVRENSNMAYSLQGLNNYLSSEISKIYWMNNIYTPEIAKAHAGGDLHIHDLNLLASYCVGWDLQHLIAEGFKGVPGKAESKPPKHFRSALGQAVNFFYTLQGESAGAQAFSSFDTLLAPFIRYDKLTDDEVKQAMQEFMFNMNVPTRVGFQTPFTNITMDMHPSSIYAQSPVAIGGKPQRETYGEFQKEMDMLNKAFFEVMIEGDAKGRPFTFPIPTYNITNNFAWDDPNFKLLWEMTAKYGIPYFANFVNSDISPDDSRSMCCRLRLDLRALERRGGGLFGANPLTGSIGVVTINLPRIGYLAKSKKDFFARVEKLMKIAKESLEIKRKALERFTDCDLYPYSKFYLASVKQRFNQYWANHFSTIGIVGMNEACLNFIGKTIADKEGRAFAESVLDFMRDNLLEFQNETGNHYNLEATPAEGTAYRLAKIDKAAHPDIVCANEKQYREGAKPFYTNSTHLPVNYTDDIFEALDHQDSLQTRYTGGTVLHGFIGESMPSAEATKNLVKKVVSQYRLPYFTITPTFSICPTHGYIPGEHFYCPRCDETIGHNATAAQKKVEETLAI